MAVSQRDKDKALRAMRGIYRAYRESTCARARRRILKKVEEAGKIIAKMEVKKK